MSHSYNKQLLWVAVSLWFLSLLVEVDTVVSAKCSAFTNPSDVNSVKSPDISLLTLIDKLGLAKYAGVFIEQEVIVFIFCLL